MDQLLNYIHQVASGEYICKPYQIKGYTKKIRKSIDELTEKIQIIFLIYQMHVGLQLDFLKEIKQ